MAKGSQVLRALSPKRHRRSAAESSPVSATGRQGSRTLFTRKKPRAAAELPELENSHEEFQRDWGIPKEEEVRRLGEFRCQVEEAVGPLRPFYDDYYLRRFLRARGHDILKAKEMFLKHLQWRKENGIDSILQDFVFQERDAFLTLYPQGYHKTDKLGRPIYIQHLGQIDMKALSKQTTEERMLKFHVQEYERALKYIFPACSKVVGRHITQTLTILDLQGVGLRHLTGDVKRIISLITRTDQDNYPETLGKTLIINAPSIFKMIWGLVKPMLDVRTQAKIEVCPSNYMAVLLRWVDAENIPEYLGGKSKGSLLDDVGPWKDPKLIAEIDADIWRRDHTTQQEPEGASPVEGPSPLAGTSPFEGSSPLESPMAIGFPHFPQHTNATDGLSSDSDGEEFHDVRSRRNSLISAASTTYLSADEEYFTPKGPEGSAPDGAGFSFSSDKPLMLYGATPPGASPAARHQAAVGGRDAAVALTTWYSNQHQSPKPPLRVEIPDGDAVSSISSAEPVPSTATATPAAAAAPSSMLAATFKQHAAVEEPLPSPPLQIPILARVRALEDKVPAMERPIRRHLPPGQQPPSKVVGEGTLLSRVTALERAMETLLTAQDGALSEAKRRAEQQESSDGCCSCCAIM